MQYYLVHILLLCSYLLSSLCSKAVTIQKTKEAIQAHEPPCDDPNSALWNNSTTSSSAELHKRTQSTAPNGQWPYNYQELFTGLEQAGWMWHFVPGHWFSPAFTSSSYITGYIDQCLAVAAARMLASVPLTSNYVLFGAGNPLSIIVTGRQRCLRCGRPANALTWELVGYLLLYLRNHAARGFTGTGSLYLVNSETQIAIKITLVLRDGIGQVLPQPCGHSSRC